MAAPSPATERAALLWPLLKKRAAKRKTLTRAEAAETLATTVEGAHAAAWPLHVWCWVRGLPPLNVVLVQRGKTADPEGGFEATDYDVLHEALGHSVYTLEQAWHYPWDKVPDPTPEQLAWALDLHAHHREAVATFRFLDLELELRHRDEARGRRRPAPRGHATWKEAEAAHKDLARRLQELGVAERDLRPPGKGPYPPSRPVVGNWAD